MVNARIKKLALKKGRLIREGKLKEAMDVCVELSNKFVESGEYRESVKEMEERIQLSTELNNKTEIAKCHREIAETLALNLNEYDEGLAHCRQYIELAESNNDKLEYQRAQFTLGRLMWVKAEGSGSHKLFLKADSQFEKTFHLLEDLAPNSSPKDNAQMQWGCCYNRALIRKSMQQKEEAYRLLCKANEIGQKCSLDEQLAQSLLEAAKLSLCLEKREETKILINKALQISRLSPKVKSAIYECQADLQIENSQFDMARASLLEALKQYAASAKDDDVKQRRWKLRGVEKCAKVYSEILTAEGKGELFEKLGDYLTKLSYKKLANFFYEKALNSFKEKNPAQLLYSIGLNFFEIRDFSKALRYFEREIEMDFSDETAEKILICKFKLTSDVNDVVHYAEELKSKAAGRAESLSKIDDVLSRLSEGDIFDEDIEEEMSDFSSMSENSEEENLSPNRQRKKRLPTRSRVNLKKNEYGETELHRMCQQDSMLHKVKDLIKKYGDVDVTDISGYTPLNEAAAFGHLEYVKVLIDAGANINHRQSDAATPLISASGNGHLDVIKYLIEKGADVTVQDKYGWTASDFIKEFLLNKEDNLREDEINELKRLRWSMKEKISQKRKMFPGAFIPKQPKSQLFVNNSDENLANEERESKSSVSRGTRTKFHKRNMIWQQRDLQGLDDDVTEETLKSEGAHEYKEAIECLRNRPSLSSQTSEKSEGRYRSFSYKRTVEHIDDDRDVSYNLDDWLEDDISSNVSKAKRKSKEATISTSSKRQRVRSSSLHLDKEEYPEQKFEIKDNTTGVTDVPAPVIAHESPDQTSRKRSDERHDFTVKSGKMRFEVQIQNRTLRIPMNSSDTVGALCKEAARRFNSHPEVVTKIDISVLKTKDGVILDSDDIIEDVLNSAELLIADVLSCDFPPLHQRYSSICSKMNVSEMQRITSEFKKSESSNRLEISMPLRELKTMESIFKALKFEETLVELSLTKCKLRDYGAILLWPSLFTLKSLKKLDLSSNILSHKSIEEFAKCLTDDGNFYSSPLNGLEELSLGFNFLGNAASKALQQIVRETSLKSLDLRSCNLKSGFFNDWRDVFHDLNKTLESLNISLNALNQQDKDSLHQNLGLRCNMITDL